MTSDEIFSAKKILIYGYGTEGRSTEKFLKSKFSNANIEIADDILPEFSKPQTFENFDVIFVSPGINRDKIKGISSEKITSQTEFFFKNITEEERDKIIGITGTKGKSTTVKFCAEMLRNAGKRIEIGGNFGIPLLDLFNNFKAGKYDFIVAELSSYQLEHLKNSPGIAIFLNLFQDHLDRHKTIKNYFEAKKNIWRFQGTEHFLIIPEEYQKINNEATSGQIFFSLDMPEEFFPENSVFRAKHFRHNFGTIRKLAELIGISEDIILKTAQNFQGLPHRLEFFMEKNNIKFYDDSISTNPDSTMAGIRFFEKKLGSIILGGQNRNQDFDELMDLLKNTSVHIIILDSETSHNLEKFARLHHIAKEKISKAETLEEAVKIAFEKTEKNKVCLLSPAAPSFDRFKNFHERGELFKKYISNS